ncbi:MAG: glycine C-acetyltransferase [Phycisphaerae bacterium]
MYGRMKDDLQRELVSIREAGLFKEERTILVPQAPDIKVSYPTGTPAKEVINFCANNYLGLSSHPKVIEAAREALATHGFGMSSVRFICGTQDIHQELEEKISHYLGMEDTILYAACFDANGGLFEPLLGKEDAILTDSLNHASIIDGIRLCKATRFIYEHNNMGDLEAKLKESSSARYRMIATDGAFSMDGDVAKLDQICDLADKHDAIVMVDDCHCSGFMGKTGRGSAEHCGVMGRVDVITSTLGKALGGSSGGFTSGPSEIIDLLRQRSRPYLFSNTLSPVVVKASIAVIDLISESTELRDKLEANTRQFRDGMTAAGFDIPAGDHPITPIMLYNAKLSQDIARDIYEEGIYVIGFYFPVVPKGKARIRVQLSAAHEPEHIARAVEAFTKIGQKYGILGKSREEIIEQYGE